MLYTAYSKAEIAIDRFIQTNGRSKDNPDGFTSGETLLMMKMFKLSRKKGFCFATNEKLGKMLTKSADSVENTLKRLRKRGFVISFQLYSKMAVPYRFLVLDPAIRAILTDRYGSPENGWAFIITTEDELPSNWLTECICSDSVSTNNKLLTSFPPSRERRTVSLQSSQTTDVQPDGSSTEVDTPPPAGVSTDTPPEEVVALAPAESTPRPRFYTGTERPPHAKEASDLTDPESIPPYIKSGQYLAHVAGTPELQVFQNIYGIELIRNDHTFIRSLCRSIRRGRFTECVDKFNWLRTVSTAPTDFKGNYISHRAMLRNLEKLSEEFVINYGADKYQKIKDLEERLVVSENPVELAESALDKYESFVDNPFGVNWSIANNYAYQIWDRTEFELKERREWHWFMWAVVNKRPELSRWKTDAECRNRLTDSLLRDFFVVEMLEVLGVNVCEDYLGHPKCALKAAHATLLLHTRKRMKELYRSNKLGIFFQRDYIDRQRQLIANAS